MKRFFFSLLLACFTLTLAALAQAQTPKPGGTLVFGLERQLSTFNPFIRAGGVDLDVRTLIYEGLLDKDTKGNITRILFDEAPDISLAYVPRFFSIILVPGSSNGSLNSEKTA